MYTEAQQRHYQENKTSYKASTKSSRERKRKWIREYKEAHTCTDCHESFPHYVLEFDHITEKSFCIGRYVNSVGLDKLIKEIMKCEIVCANCHSVRTWTRLHPNDREI